MNRQVKKKIIIIIKRTDTSIFRNNQDKICQKKEVA